MELAGLQVGIASEGAFGPDPYTGLITWNIEQVIFIEDSLGLEVIGTAQMVAQCGELMTDSWKEAVAFALSIGFPSHQMVVRSQKGDVSTFYKGIYDWSMLESRFLEAQATSKDRKVWLESDLRAFANLTRMENIRRATDDLLKRIKSECPSCFMPGYWRTESLPGLPCGVCHAPTQLPRGDVWRCVACSYSDTTTKPPSDMAEAKY